jgi:hypothetical protein
MNIRVMSSRGYVHNNGDLTYAYRILDVFIILKHFLKKQGKEWIHLSQNRKQ